MRSADKGMGKQSVGIRSPITHVLSVECPSSRHYLNIIVESFQKNHSSPVTNLVFGPLCFDLTLKQKSRLTLATPPYLYSLRHQDRSTEDRGQLSTSLP